VAVAVVVETEAGPLEGPIVQVAAVGGDVAAVALQGSPRCRGPVSPLSTAAATIAAATAAATAPVVVSAVSTAAAAAILLVAAQRGPPRGGRVVMAATVDAVPPRISQRPSALAAISSAVLSSVWAKCSL
jgi:hypothetical protein